jgi:hypothetical protein
MYHLELRHFPKRVHRFNLDGREIGAILIPWVQDKIVEVGENKWSPYQTTITIFEGPEISLQEVSMARGWRSAQREGTDVTEQLLAEARGHVAEVAAAAQGAGSGGGGAPGVAAPSGAPGSGGSDAPAGVDSIALAVQLGALLGPDATRLLEAWSAARARSPSLSPSAALALAEEELTPRP